MPNAEDRIIDRMAPARRHAKTFTGMRPQPLARSLARQTSNARCPLAVSLCKVKRLDTVGLAIRPAAACMRMHAVHAAPTCHVALSLALGMHGMHAHAGPAGSEHYFCTGLYDSKAVGSK